DGVRGIVRGQPAGRYDVDEIRAEPFPSGHTSRRSPGDIRFVVVRFFTHLAQFPYDWFELPPQFLGLVRLAAGLEQLDDPVACSVDDSSRRDLGFAGLEALVRLEEERRGLLVLLLTEQAGAEQAAGLEAAPVVGGSLFAEHQAFARERLGLCGPSCEVDSDE